MFILQMKINKNNKYMDDSQIWSIHKEKHYTEISFPWFEFAILSFWLSKIPFQVISKNSRFLKISTKYKHLIC